MESKPFRIVRIQNKKDALPYRASFTGVYQTIFAEAPYFERFYPSEAQAALHQNLLAPDNITLLAVVGESRVAGFCFGAPVVTQPDISRHLRGLIPIKHSFFLGGLGVLERFRGQGIGRQLIEERQNFIDPTTYTQLVMRASASKDQVYQLFHSLGFEDMGVYMEISARRVDGSVRTDRRLFLSRLLQSSEQVG